MEKTVITYGTREFILEDMTAAQKKTLKAEKPKVYAKLFLKPTPVEPPAVPEAPVEPAQGETPAETEVTPEQEV